MLVQPSPSVPIFAQIKQTLKEKLILGDARKQHLDEMLSEERKKKTLAEKRADLNLALAVGATAFAAVGHLYFWPLGVVSAAVLLYLGIPIHMKTFMDLKKGKVSVTTLLTIIVIGALFLNYLTVGGLAIVVRQMSMRLRLKVTQESKSNLIDVFRQHPSTAWLLVDGIELQVPFEEIKAGDLAIVNAGEMIPVDGTVVDGVASVDQHILTGESTLTEKSAGDQAFASTTVLSGRICIQVEQAGEETTVAKIGQMLNDTIDFRANADLRAEELADKTVVPVLIAGGLSLPFLGPMGALAILNSHFKYKMSVMAPISIMNYLNIASQSGILIKDGRTLDLLDQVDTIVFDKTGTLTEEQPHVGAIHVCGDLDEEAVLTYAAAAEHRQTHPIARAIVEAAESQNLVLPATDDTDYKLGYGLTVVIEGRVVRVGSHRFMEISQVVIPEAIEQAQAHCHQQAHSLVMVAVDDQLVGAVELLPTIRPEAKDVINTLRERGYVQEMYIISGDHTTPTQKLAEELGMDHYFAETLPQDKADIIEKLQQEGKVICYIGDGINDAIALKKSQVSISLRGASTVATDTAQIIFMDGRLHHLVSIFDLTQEFQRNINTTFAMVTVPAAVCLGGVLFLHFGLFPTIVLNMVGLAGGVANSMRPMFNNETIRKRLTGTIQTENMESIERA